MDSELIERTTAHCDMLDQTFEPSFTAPWRELIAAGIADNQRIAALEKKVAELDAECKRAFQAHDLAFDQAMKNGEEACRAKAEVERLQAMLEGVSELALSAQRVALGEKP
ncbi:MAG: hypothetical protein RL254_806 [Planctomycetota bacterium]